MRKNAEPSSRFYLIENCTIVCLGAILLKQNLDDKKHYTFKRTEHISEIAARNVYICDANMITDRELNTVSTRKAAGVHAMM